MVEGIFQDRAPDALDRLLFGPVFLASEVMGTVVPGLLLYLLLALKGNHLAVSLFQIGGLGYRTKLLCALFVGFMMGKILGTPYAMLQSGMFTGKTALQVPKTEFSEGREAALKMAMGAVLMPSLLGKSRGLDHLMMANATIYLNLSSGLALLAASAVPGDGALRYFEFGFGLLFLIAGYYLAKAFRTMLLAFIGLSVAELLQKIPIQNVPAVFKAALAAFLTLTKPEGESAEAVIPSTKPESGGTPASGAQ